MYQLNMLLKISALARSTFYYHLKESRTDKYNEAKKAITEVFTVTYFMDTFMRFNMDIPHC